MAGTTTNLSLIKPAGGEFIDVEQINSNMDKIDAAVGVFFCTSGTRPTGSSRFVGQQIFETNTKRAYFWDGTAWVAMTRFALLETYTQPTFSSTSGVDSRLLYTIPVPQATYRRSYRVRASQTFAMNVPTTGLTAVVQRWGLSISSGTPSTVGDASFRTIREFLPSAWAETSTLIVEGEGSIPANEDVLLRVWAEQHLPTTGTQRAVCTTGGVGSYNKAFAEVWPE